LEAKLPRLAQAGPELPGMKAELARVTSEVRAASPQLRADARAALAADVGRLKREVAAPRDWTGALDPRVVSDFPRLFDEFRGKRFALLWRGSRDGFRAGDFHGRCDGRANTLTLILDTEGNVFGGFTPLQWESRVWNGKHDNQHNCYKRDDSLKSFLFTLNNPHNRPARKFALKADRKQYAINCDSTNGRIFGYNSPDILIVENCHADDGSYTDGFGTTDTNDTGLKGKTFFTGSANFTVREIEVFEITD
jgi:hypothetical protein